MPWQTGLVDEAGTGKSLGNPLSLQLPVLKSAGVDLEHNMAPVGIRLSLRRCHNDWSVYLETCLARQDYALSTGHCSITAQRFQ
mmetsp:Transcript_9962/g.18181  ORF Transcript_9962/g.18181 Transcript_9962/m.18181 type:complete len:84 (-) Transcript_9962:876-1127(-)